MWSLETLHLSGNGLGGILPSDLQPLLTETLVADDFTTDDAVVSNRTLYVLNDVSLASNALYGGIPLS
jgi:hypothetical protein